MKIANIYFEGNLVSTVKINSVDYGLYEDRTLLLVINDEQKRIVVAIVPNNHLIVIE